MQPSKLDASQAAAVAKAAFYVGVSAVLSFLITSLADHPDAFGVVTPVVNVILVTIKQIFTEPER